MTECFVTNRDIRTKFNPLFHRLKIHKIEAEIEEMYHLGTTITNYQYDIGFITTRSHSAEDAAISIIEKKEHLLNEIKRHQRFIKLHETALFNMRDRHEDMVLCFQSSIMSHEEVGEIFGIGRQRVIQIINGYRVALSRMLTEDECNDVPISNEEIDRLSEVIDNCVMYESKLTDKTLDPLHGMAKWHVQDRERRMRNKESQAII